MIHAVVLDFDGLILDTETAVYESWRRTWEDHGQVLPLDKWHQSLGTDGRSFHPLRELETRIGRRFEDEEAVMAARQRVRDQILEGLAPMPGILELLEAATAGGLGRGVASSSPRSWVEPHLERLGLRSYFDSVVTRDDVEFAKPRPDLYLESVSRLGVGPSEAVAFEDSPNGVTAAKAAGLFCVAIPCDLTRTLGFDHADLHIHSLADHTLETLLAQL